MLALPAVGAFGGFGQRGHEKSKGAKMPEATGRMEQAWRDKNTCRGRNSRLILQAEWMPFFLLVI
jgi:hypothetical protein